MASIFFSSLSTSQNLRKFILTTFVVVVTQILRQWRWRRRRKQKRRRTRTRAFSLQLQLIRATISTRKFDLFWKKIRLSWFRNYLLVLAEWESGSRGGEQLEGPGFKFVYLFLKTTACYHHFVQGLRSTFPATNLPLSVTWPKITLTGSGQSTSGLSIPPKGGLFHPDSTPVVLAWLLPASWLN